ncbi:hypothetical protein K2X14_09330 [Acetobacter sp. TBRC 12305]|uniref:Uncharacterized protein n=1 Tax=Acetobacter garciniae TaxID=2817435 RepID=A0A939HNY3_9PROT|nr:hypothetical protein [Acetobacter garciniae]MBO1326670.1 hypothetical protein [Acetobacter garciniae]MBX0345035.1 hypothetical protein [Acetobacter garciniae]
MGTSQKQAISGRALVPDTGYPSCPVTGDEKNRLDNRFFLPQAGLGMTSPPSEGDVPPLLRKLSARAVGPRTSLFRK